MKEKYQELLATLERGFRQARDINRAGSPTNIHRALEESMQECRGRIADLTRLEERRKFEKARAAEAVEAALAKARTPNAETTMGAQPPKGGTTNPEPAQAGAANQAKAEAAR